MKVAPLNESYNSNDRDSSKNENVPHEFIYVKPASKKPFIMYSLYKLYCRSTKSQILILLYCRSTR